MSSDTTSGLVAGNFQYAEGEYQGRLKKSQEAGNCLFCNPAWQADEEHPVLKREGAWFIRERTKRYPSPDRAGKYPARYLLIVRDIHGEDLSPTDWVEIGTLFKWALEHFEIPGGGLCMRFGGTLGGRTIYHHHLHLVQPNQKGVNEEGHPLAEPWDFPVG